MKQTEQNQNSNKHQLDQRDIQSSELDRQRRAIINKLTEMTRKRKSMIIDRNQIK